MTLPLLARPQAITALAVGLGGGVLLEDLPPSIASIDVVELESEVLAANRRISPLRHSDPLQDTRIQIMTNDARNALALSARPTISSSRNPRIHGPRGPRTSTPTASSAWSRVDCTRRAFSSSG